MELPMMERRGRLEDLDRAFDVEFWQAQPPAVRFQAAWELILHVAKLQGLDVHQLRLQRSVEAFQRQGRKDDLITVKRAAGRPQDLIDVDLLVKSKRE